MEAITWAISDGVARLQGRERQEMIHLLFIVAALAG